VSLVQPAAQLMPDGLEVTVPVPPPLLVSVSTLVVPNVATTVSAAFMVTVHVLVPEQPPPDQPVNTEPLPATAVSVTEVLGL
jgi:hypothetical protein